MATLQCKQLFLINLHPGQIATLKIQWGRFLPLENKIMGFKSVISGIYKLYGDACYRISLKKDGRLKRLRWFKVSPFLYKSVMFFVVFCNKFSFKLFAVKVFKSKNVWFVFFALNSLRRLSYDKAILVEAQLLCHSTHKLVCKWVYTLVLKWT